MTLCASVKKKNSKDPCPASAIRGHTLCGRHLRAKTVTLWTDVHRDKLRGLVTCQALWRAWKVRRLIRLAGPGAMSRSKCTNDEDLCTCNEKERESPLNYFGLEENGKVWWFSFGTLWDWSIRSIEPSNPYTKVPLSEDTLFRLRKLYLLRRRYRMELPAETKDFNERMVRRWTTLCQIFRSYGFADVHPLNFIDISRHGFTMIFTLLHDDLMDMNPRPFRALDICGRGLRNTGMGIHNYMLLSTTLLHVLLMESNSYPIVFHLMSAIYRC